uniref:Uncharacterized protein n=1 Tax=Anguilla anguilla TaxID=7936 RepID=A0A0E9RMK6_ANGAN
MEKTWFRFKNLVLGIYVLAILISFKFSFQVTVQ